MALPYLFVLPGFLLVGLGLYWHRHRRAIFPEDAPSDPHSGGRKRHAAPTPLIGVIPGSCLVLLYVQRPALAAAIAVLVLAGWLDDRHKDAASDPTGSPGWRTKLVWQMAAVALALIDLQPRYGLDLWPCAMTGLLLLVAVNACNFLDNTDGVSLGLAGFGLLWAGGMNGPHAAAGFLLLGVLPFNWPRSTVFCGDSGVLAFGLLLGVACAERPTLAWRDLTPMAMFLLDFGQVILARLAVGVSPFVGDRRHLTHIVQRMGVPPVLIAPLFVSVAAAIWWNAR